jgi:hypothetical protein
VKAVIEELQAYRNEAYFCKLFTWVINLIQEYDLDEIKLPRKRTTTSRYTGSAATHFDDNELDYYRRQYFEYIDLIKKDLTKRFDNEDLQQYQALEKVLLSAEKNQVTSHYPELDNDTLIIQLQMFRHQNEYKSATEAAKCLREQLSKWADYSLK